MTHGLPRERPRSGKRGRRRSQHPAQDTNLFDQSTSARDVEEGRRRRDEGTRRAEQGATAVHRRAGERALAELAATGEPFTSDDLHDHLDLTLKSNLVGALFRAASTRGLIEAVGYTESQRPSRNAGVIRVWRGVGHG